MKKEHPIEALIAQGEHRQLDFKFEVSDSKKIARTLSAFANTDGGRLLIGVKDNGSIAGIRSEEEYYMIEAASTMYTKPSVPFTATRWELNGKTVLEVYIAPGDKKPYTAPDKDDKYKAYIRVADENKLANEVLLYSWRKKERLNGLLLPLTHPVKKILVYLESHPYINIRQFCRIAHINYYTARNILSDLIAVNTLKYSVVDKQIVYSMVASKLSVSAYAEK
jgi:predicted HTH transcriptional regulator